MFLNLSMESYVKMFMKLTLILEHFHWKLCQDIFETNFDFLKFLWKICQNLQENNINFWTFLWKVMSKSIKFSVKIFAKLELTFETIYAKLFYNLQDISIDLWTSLCHNLYEISINSLAFLFEIMPKYLWNNLYFWTFVCKIMSKP